MIRYITASILALLICPAYSQINPIVLTTLDPVVSETSGLTRINGKFLTHNDSGDGPFLYEIDTTTGGVNRTVYIAGAGASDWEDITHDSTHIFIGDFGNNAGNRQNLRIYRVPIADYLLQDTVQADTIHFSYADQTDFSSQTFQTNFDAEGLAAWGDSLYIFTKNWGNFRTNIYPISKQPGTYSIVKRDSIDSQGLVTGAEFDPVTNSIWLVGYFLSIQFLVEIPAVNGLPFSGPGTIRHGFTPLPAIQVEAICPVDATTWLVSAEAGQGASSAHLYRFSPPLVSQIPALPNQHITAFPNPTDSAVKVHIEGVEIGKVKWFTATGKRFKTTRGTVATVSKWPAGVYIAEPLDHNNQSLGRIRVVVK